MFNLIFPTEYLFKWLFTIFFGNLIIFYGEIIFLEKTNFFELEFLVSKAKLLISCHGATTHVAAALNIKIIDIFDNSKIIFYQKWTSHFRKHKYIERDIFKSLASKIINIL